MEYRILGRTGVKVSVMGIGCGGPSRVGVNTGKTENESIAVIRKALDAGINFVDTAEAYKTEGIVGKAIKGVPRDSVVISTKKSTGNDRSLAPEDVRNGLDASLQRLGTDYVDVYHLHGATRKQYDYLASEIVPTLYDLRDEGKIRFLGITEGFGPDSGHAMFQRALQDDFWDVIMVGFNILNQTARQRVLPITIEKNIGVLIMFAVRKALSRPERLKEVVQELLEKGQLDPAEIDVHDPLGFLMHEGGAVSMSDAAYRFCRDEPGTHVILSGTGNPEHLQANMESLLRPPLSPQIVECLKHIFRNVDSVAGN